MRHFGDPAIIHVDGDVHRELRKGIAPHYAAGKVADYIDGIVRPIALRLSPRAVKLIYSLTISNQSLP